MKLSTATPAPSASANRCLYRAPAGRRCRAEAHDVKLGLCPKHATSLPAAQPSADFRQRLTDDTDEFTTAMGIHNSLSELYKLLAADLISARRAAVLAYIANLLLRTIPIVHSELDPESSKDPVRIDIDFGDLPRPNRNQPATIPAGPGLSS
jgi:hypothetical protein